MKTATANIKSTQPEIRPSSITPNRMWHTRRQLSRISLYVGIVALTAIFILPIFWLLISSLKAEVDFVKWPPVWLPAPPQWVNYLTVFTNERFGFLTHLFRSVILAVMFAVPNVLFSAFAGYGFARIRAPGRNPLFVILLAEMMIPGRHVRQSWSIQFLSD